MIGIKGKKKGRKELLIPQKRRRGSPVHFSDAVSARNERRLSKKAKRGRK